MIYGPLKPGDENKNIPIQGWLVPLLIAAACLIAYYPALNAGFLSDDFNYLYGHAESPAGGAKGASFFRPLGIFSLRLDFAFYAENAFGCHITNLLLHFAAAWG